MLEGCPWFNHTLWRVDFYGDATTININNVNKFLNIQNYDDATIKKLFNFAFLSIAKQHNLNKTVLLDTNIVGFFNNLLKLNPELNKLNIDFVSIINEAFTESVSLKEALNKEHTYKKLCTNIWDTSIGLFKDNIPFIISDGSIYRNLYYDHLKDMDRLYNKIHLRLSNNEQVDFNDIQQYSLQLAKVNKYREENYMLLDTVYHIVTCMQSSIINNDQCVASKTIVTSICNCLGSNNYILSIIEQFGYLLHKLYQEENNIFITCSIDANKYFERIMKGLDKIEIFNQKKNSNSEIQLLYEKIQKIIIAIKKIKEKRSTDLIPSQSCIPNTNEEQLDIKIDFLKMLFDLLA